MTDGPFDVSGDQIKILEARFTGFANRLLSTEYSAQRLAGHLLGINVNENAPDGGVDAKTTSVPGGLEWLPEGDTGWQYKRGKLSEAKCAVEIAGATEAREILQSGGSYVLLLGWPYPPTEVEKRRKAVAEKAIDLGILDADNTSRIRVYDANRLALWASQLPSISASQFLGGARSDAVDFETWRGGRTHRFDWVPDQERVDSVTDLRDRISLSGEGDIRVQGLPGVGKTRMILEALGDQLLQPLVAYVHDADSLRGSLLDHLVANERRAILVVDECPPGSHIKIVERLPTGPNIKLITIGEMGAAATPTPIVGVKPMLGPDIEKFLDKNYPTLDYPAKRFVTEHCRGNVRWTIVLADRVINTPGGQAAELIQRDDIEAFISDLLPEGRDFFMATILALFERVGWDRELEPELEVLAEFCQATVQEMKDLGAVLMDRGLLVRQGRYRAISPQPLAVFLAANAWRTEGARIAEALLPRIDIEMASSLFNRAADLGRYEPAQEVISQLLSADGPFGSMQEIENSGSAKLLTQLAIVLPDETAAHIADLLDAVTTDELRGYRSSRRDMVWTLEKLGWHSQTFRSAANSLIRLALAENETYANNSTGTWVSLFGAMLPSTAATPASRIEYLSAIAGDVREERRSLAVKGARQAIVHPGHESGTVSAEVQGGVLVEPQGRPKTYEELAEYQKAAMGLLKALSEDSDPEIAASAREALLAALLPFIDDERVGTYLADILVHLQGDALRELKVNARHILNLQVKHPMGRDRLVANLNALLERLPVEGPTEELDVLLHMNRWDAEEGELQAQIDDVVMRLEDPAERTAALQLLDSEVKAAYEFGHAIATSGQFDEGIEDRLLSVLNVNAPAVVGYLIGLVESGSPDAFDSFLDEYGSTLDYRDRLFLTTRGPVTDKSRERLLAGLPQLTVVEGVATLFGWTRNLSESESHAVLREWMSRIETIQDYEAVVDWLNLYLHPAVAMPESLVDSSWELILSRREFPDLGRARWDWNHLASMLLEGHEVEMAGLILDLVQGDAVMVMPQDDESSILVRCIAKYPQELWSEVGSRLESETAWRLEMQVRGWLVASVPVDVVASWVGGDLERARLVAAISSAGAEEPTPVARLLLGKFGGDERVRANISSEFLSGWWTGPESARLSQKIGYLKGWRSRADLPAGVRSWAKEMISHLTTSRHAALEREAERGY